MLIVLFFLGCTGQKAVEIERLSQNHEALEQQFQSQQTRLGDLERRIKDLEMRARKAQNVPPPDQICQARGRDIAVALDDAPRLFVGARALPNQNPQGEVVGVEIERLKANSLPRSCGIHGGDIIHAINGHATLSARDLIQHLTEQSKTGRLVLTLTRSGASVSHTLRVEGVPAP